MKILSLSEFIPEHICDTIRFTGFAGDRNISHYCGYASDFIYQVLYDDSIDGAVFPKSCDSSRIMKNYLENSGKFLYQFPVPIRNDETGINFYASVLLDFEKKLNEHYGNNTNNIGKRIEAINQRNFRIREIYDSIESKSFYDFLHSVHIMLTKPLLEQWVDVDDIAMREPTEKRIYIVGSFLSNERIVKIMEDNGLTVVGDNLPEIGRLASCSTVSIEGNLYKNIAKSILSMRKSPTQDDFKDICEFDISEIKRKKVKGVVFITQKYCEPYDYLFYQYKKKLDILGIPSIQISLFDSQDEGKANLKIEAFADMI